MDRLKAQAAKLVQLLLAADTFAAYQKALQITWEIIKETALLIWLVICLVLVLGDWFWKTATQLGQSTRSWFTNMQEVSSDQVATETGKALLTAGSSTINFTLNKAREQLGLPIPEEPPAPVEVTPPPAPKPVAAPKVEAPKADTPKSTSTDA